MLTCTISVTDGVAFKLQNSDFSRIRSNGNEKDSIDLHKRLSRIHCDLKVVCAATEAGKLLHFLAYVRYCHYV